MLQTCCEHNRKQRKHTHTEQQRECVCVCLSLSRVVVCVPEGRLTGAMTGGLPAVRMERKSWRWILASKRRESGGFVEGGAAAAHGGNVRREVFPSSAAGLLRSVSHVKRRQALQKCGEEVVFTQSFIFTLLRHSKVTHSLLRPRNSTRPLTFTLSCDRL